jgi:membrane protease YdiL (CAAX protease family)
MAEIPPRHNVTSEQPASGAPEPNGAGVAGLRRRDLAIAFFAYFGAQALVWAVAGVFASLRVGNPSQTADLVRALTRVVPIALPGSFLAGGLALILVLGRWKRRLGGGSLAGLVGLSWGNPRHLRHGVLAGAALAFLVLPLMGLTADRGQSPEMVTQLVSSSRGALRSWIFSAVLLAPPIEELMFRGVLLGGLARTWNLRAAAIISGAIFWLMHLPEFVHWPVPLAIGLLTILATLFRLQSGALGPAIAAHLGYNLILAGMLSLALLVKPPQSRWASSPGEFPSATPQGEDRELRRAAETSGNRGRAHAARYIKRSEGVAIPAFKETTGAYRLHCG